MGTTELRNRFAVTCNVLGPEDGTNPTARLKQALGVRGAHVHLYAKTARPGRKLGHVTASGTTFEDVQATARHAASLLSSTTPIAGTGPAGT